MEVLDGDRSLTLGGIKRRATLGYLLLHANRVVATSQLIGALWSVDDAPLSARKILQNAVWGLRRELNRTPSPADGVTAALDTKSPGYRLRVEPEDVDLFRFHRRADEGRAGLAAGEPGRAARVLRDALGLWRGPVLADLVEAGFAWPELVAAQNARWNVMEDYFHAELACGHHLAVLEELESMVARTALRERSSGQLMLALYPSGRQADALGVYTTVRTALVEGFGL
ncbi:BTAD domain-containing putative transcriptional regulator, partial [Streptomyces sp. NPDC058953]|uniref:AfsR/SARP family transcriptional regulator n=1 Tax=Streptomyces sp. NPDC058953 TaxID=3346676 RepID=UPI0036D02F7B